MKILINTIADLITEEIDAAEGWTIERNDPMYRNPEKGKVLSIFAPERAPTGTRTNEGIEQSVAVVIEFTEPAVDQAEELAHNETNELDSYDLADLIMAWGMSHQMLGWDGGGAHAFNWLSTSYAPDTDRELFVRFFRVIFEARVYVDYA